jgi:hypothetical protein
MSQYIDNTSIGTNNTVMYCVFHKQFYLRDDNSSFTFFGVNETYPKIDARNNNANVILEHELSKYNPFLQKRGYMETSAYLHVYWNKLYEGKDMIGFSQYDMKHLAKYENLNTSTIYLLNAGQPIVRGGEWNPMMCPQLRNLDFLVQSYNRFFSKSYSIKELENVPLSLWQTNIYPVGIYEKLCAWLEVLVEDIYPWSNLPPYETHFGSIGGYTERALSIFNAFQIFEGVGYTNLPIQHGIGACEKEQYNQKSFLNTYSQDIHARFISDITGDYDDTNYCMFKAQCYLGDVLYSCERVNRKNDGKTGLRCICSADDCVKEYSFDIEAEDPRLVDVNGKIYIVFICLSPYSGQQRCIGISAFDEWNPVFLQLENMPKNEIEKNWAPFAKGGELFFVYNYDPLVILSYDLNLDGICKIVFMQGELPINTSITYLRGGSNLIHYKDGYYIGGCHSRIDKKDWFEHYTHIILLDTNSWKLVYVSKPVMYLCDELRNISYNSWWLSSPSVKTLDMNYNILTDRIPHIIQDPISFYMKDNKYYITVNVRDSISLLYEISFANLFDFIQEKPIGYYNNYIKEMLI